MLNFKKCELFPPQQFEFVGTAYNLAESRVTPTEKRITSLCKVTNLFCQAGNKSAREFMSLIGLLNATFLQVNQIGRLNIRPTIGDMVIRCINVLWFPKLWMVTLSGGF